MHQLQQPPDHSHRANSTAAGRHLSRRGASGAARCSAVAIIVLADAHLAALSAGEPSQCDERIVHKLELRTAQQLEQYDLDDNLVKGNECACSRRVDINQIENREGARGSCKYLPQDKTGRQYFL